MVLNLTTTAEELIAPIVHLNGTSKASLLEGYSEILDALRKAETALYSNGPNGRDYYLKPGLFEKAVAQHRSRIEAIGRVHRDIEAIALKIA
jgi:hypothetical protein